LMRAEVSLVAGQQRLLERQRTRLESVGAQLRALSPEHTLARGYAIVRTETGQILRKAIDAQTDQALLVTLAQGELKVRVR
ncbi:MAG: exodeoxyribonuclease VII large subunit, partial [Alcaligenaceae bacterium]